MTRRVEDAESLMRRALRLARRGQGRVEPNPMVGCVIVKGGRVLGEGYHRRFGGPHAEVEALRRCAASPRGATVYVTLEPCCHYGKTPPCTEALIGAGVARVVAAVADPNPAVRGGGFRRLEAAGIATRVGVLEAEARALNAPFFKLVERGRPWVILKWAQSLDGKIAARSGDSKWISDEACRAHAHRVRGRLDAILVGVSTVRADDPLLTCRVGRPRRIATRVVLDTHLRTPPKCRLVRTAAEVPTWICCGRNASASRARRLERAGCVVQRLRTTRQGVSLPALLDRLGGRGMANVLVEGGGALLGAFHDQGLADEYQVYVAPLLIGGTAAPGPLQGSGAAHVAAAARVPEPVRVERIGNGLFVAWRVR